VTGARHFRALGLGAAALALIADQGSKLALLYGAGFARMAPGEFVPLLPHFNLVMVWNPGVSYGLFAGAPIGVLVGLAVAAICGLFWWLWTTTSRAVALGTGLVIGGAIGNDLIDRVV
jgi:signal peptidase II